MEFTELATFCGIMPGATRAAASSSAIHILSPGICCSAPYDHRVAATPCDVMARTCVSAAVCSSAAHVCAPGDFPNVANAYSVFDTSGLGVRGLGLRVRD